MDIGRDLLSVRIPPGDRRGKLQEVTGTGTEVRFDLLGGLPGNIEMILAKLGEDFSFVCLVVVKSEEEDGQQTSCR
jgi:hypothetical protein